MDGILIINKPAGITSHDVVWRARKILHGERTGHTGTLDPFATGVIAVLVGRATRLAQFLDKDTKEYEAIIKFGFETTTGDPTGKPKSVQNPDLQVIKEDVEDVLPELKGEIEQMPPMFSAKKVKGKKLYELARKGIEIERKPIKVTIYEIEMSESGQKLDNTEVAIRVVCSAGTYIRVLAEDIGKKIGIGAHLSELNRTRSGNFELSKAITLDELEQLAAKDEVGTVLISMNAAVSHLPKATLTAEQVEKTHHGMKVKFDGDAVDNGDFVRLVDENDTLVAVGAYDESDQSVQPKTVFI
jgi:tRNA pseudouridine55 synthase